jgi:hypothetical protein
MSESGYRLKCLKQKINTCHICGTGDDLIVHHIDGNRENNRLENLIPLCRQCHSRVHTKAKQSDAIDELSEKLPSESYVDTPSAGDNNTVGGLKPDDMERIRELRAAIQYENPELNVSLKDAVMWAVNNELDKRND